MLIWRRKENRKPGKRPSENRRVWDSNISHNGGGGGGEGEGRETSVVTTVLSLLPLSNHDKGILF